MSHQKRYVDLFMIRILRNKTLEIYLDTFKVLIPRMSIICVVFRYDNNDIFLGNYDLNDAPSSVMEYSRIESVVNAIQIRIDVLHSLWNI